MKVWLESTCSNTVASAWLAVHWKGICAAIHAKELAGRSKLSGKTSKML